MIASFLGSLAEEIIPDPLYDFMSTNPRRRTGVTDSSASGPLISKTT